MSDICWGRRADDPGTGWAVVDVETSGMRPPDARVVSIAVLALDVDGRLQHTFSTLLDPGTGPGPTHVHGITAEMLEGQPTFGEVAGEIAGVIGTRTLVAHNAPFDYAFLTAEAEIAGVALSVDSVMCTLELARRLDLEVDNLRLQTLAAHWGVAQTRAHDALDDAHVLAGVLPPSLRRAAELGVWLPVRPVGRRRWPNGRVTHDELRPLKAVAARMPCCYVNPGRYVSGGRLVQGMRVALSPECTRTHEEIIERILHAGLVYTDVVDDATSLVVCNQDAPQRGKGSRARQLGIPLLRDREFLGRVADVDAGTVVEEFTGGAAPNEQFALF